MIGEQIQWVKTITVGDSGVGKSSILARFSQDKFQNNTHPTLSIAFNSKKLAIPGYNHVIDFHLWDTAGQQRYRSLSPIYYKQARIALCVYDITSLSSFQNAKLWLTELRTSAPKDVIIALVGNKTDRCHEVQVQQQLAKSYSHEIGAIFMQVSAKQGKNVTELFTQLAVKFLASQGKADVKAAPEQKTLNNEVKKPYSQQQKIQAKEQKNQILQKHKDQVREMKQKEQIKQLQQKEENESSLQFFKQLSDLNLSKETVQIFNNQAINSWEILNSMTKQDLLFLKIKFGDVTRILSAIKK